MNLRIAIPVAMAALFFCGSAQYVSAKTYKHKHMSAKTGKQVRTGVKKQSATGGPSGGSTKNATGAGS